MRTATALIAALVLCAGCELDGESNKEQASTDLSSVDSETLLEIVISGTNNTVHVGDDIITVTAGEAKGVLVDRGVL